MQSHFDTDAENAKLAAIREREEEDLTRLLAERNGYGYTDLSIVPINVDALRLIPEADARAAELVLFDKNGRHISAAFRDARNEHIERILHDFETRGFQVARHLASHKSLNVAYARYAELSQATESKRGVFDIGGTELAELSASLTSIPALTSFLDESLEAKHLAATSRVLEGILAAAFAMHASDIHVEPEETGIRLRLRLDGLLTDTYFFDPHAYRLINSRIKLLSGLKLNISDRAQDGRFSVVVNNKEIEIRTSVIPGGYGESIVMRILDPDSILRGVDDMDIDAKLLARLKEEIKRPNGMLLTTGPTGSGKTTTLYAFLRHVHTPDIKIITIEDPIEYHVPGIVQTQVDGRDYTFASGLRSVLRQDPDVIMVGEIRDMEVAETAIQAALTGHLVFSTLHTNNAAGAFPRLMDLGVDPKTIPSAVTVAMAQRLVRRLDPKTRIERATTDEEKRMMERVFSSLSDPTLRPASFDKVWTAPQSSDTHAGYHGRLGVHEAIFMDDQLAEQLRMGPSSAEIEKETRRQGFLTMAQDGILKALRGDTSLEEVLKVVDIPRG